LGAATSDTLLTSLLEALTMAEQRLLLAQADYGPSHPDVVKAKLQAEDLRNKIATRADGVMEGMEARVDALGQGLTNLMHRVESAKQEDSEIANRCRPYLNAKRHLETAQAFLRLLETKIASETINQSDGSPVEVVDPAVPPPLPAGSNRLLATSLMALGLLLDLLGVRLLKWRL
jgi:uncharacterized protein involved in exopolysaccharide biosynthesis